MVLEVALNGSADCIVTHNVRDFRQAIPKSGFQFGHPAACWKDQKMSKATYPLKPPP